MALLSSCRPDRTNTPLAPPLRLPIISMQDAYPGGAEPADFWAEKQRFFQEYESRLKAGAAGPEERAAMRHLYDIELLRRAGEARIREYNRIARETNLANGYGRAIDTRTQ